MARWHHRLNGHELREMVKVREAWRGAAVRGVTESDTTEQLSNSNNSPSEGPEEAAEPRTHCNHEFPAIPQSCTVLTGNQIQPLRESSVLLHILI